MRLFVLGISIVLLVGLVLGGLFLRSTREEPPVTPELAGPEPGGRSESSGELAAGHRERVAVDPEPAAGGPGPTESDATRSLTIELQVARTLARNAEPVPDVPCELGVGLGGPGWNGPPPRQRLVLGTATTDASGRATVEVEVPEAFFARDDEVVLWGRPIGPGLKQRFGGVALPTDGVDRVLLRLMAQPGATLRGRVYRAEGAPEDGGLVRLVERREDGSPRVESKTGVQEGEFELHFDRSGVYHVLARDAEHGTASLLDLAIDVSEPPQDLELRLAGDGALAGRVVDPVGRPMRQYTIWACPAEHPDQWVGYFSDPKQIPHELEGRGLHDARLATDDEGRFRFTGLRPGHYLIRGKTGATGYYERVLTPSPVATGREDLLLKAERHRLVVRVLDHEGELVRPQVQHHPGREPRAHALFCLESDPEGRILDHDPYPSVDRSWSEAGDTLFEVEPGKSYAFGVVSAREPLVEEVVHIDQQSWEVVRTLRLGAPRVEGSLRLQIETPAGVPIGSHSENPFVSSTQVRVFGPRSGVLIRGTPRYHRGADFETPLAAGDYHVEIDAEPGRGHHGERLGAKQFTGTERRVTIGAGARTDLVISLGQGGHLELALDHEGEPDAQRWPASDDEGAWSGLRESRRGGRVTLRPLPDGETLVPSFEVPDGPELFGPHECDWVASGTEARSLTLLPVGDYLLRVVATGYPPAEQRITIAPDSTTKVAVVLRASR